MTSGFGAADDAGRDQPYHDADAFAEGVARQLDLGNHVRRHAQLHQQGHPVEVEQVWCVAQGSALWLGRGGRVGEVALQFAWQ